MRTYMRHISLVLFLLFTLCSSANTTFAAERKTAVETVKGFYKRYLSYDYAKTPKTPRPTIALSKAFSGEVKKTADICKKYGEGPCGWGADGDEYLDAQETDPNLSYSNSRIAIREIRPGMVQVKLNVYPSIKDAGDFYDRTITYKMVMENGSWAVDDIAYSDGVSTRKKLSDERANTLAYPRQDAAGQTCAPAQL
jgi:hypothetical protein